MKSLGNLWGLSYKLSGRNMYLSEAAMKNEAQRRSPRLCLKKFPNDRLFVIMFDCLLNDSLFCISIYDTVRKVITLSQTAFVKHLNLYIGFS